MNSEPGGQFESIDSIKVKAEAGDAEAQYNLGIHFAQQSEEAADNETHWAIEIKKALADEGDIQSLQLKQESCARQKENAAKAAIFWIGQALRQCYKADLVLLAEMHFNLNEVAKALDCCKRARQDVDALRGINLGILTPLYKSFPSLETLKNQALNKDA